MKAERINQDQIRFTLNQVDLQKRDIKVSELAYGSEKTKKLFDDMMKTAKDQFGVDFSRKPLMIEAIPLSEDALSITVTRVSGEAEAGILFGSNLPIESKDKTKDKAPAEKDQSRKEKSKNSAEPGEYVVYAFRSFEELCQMARHVPKRFMLRNQLYYGESKKTYYLVVQYKHINPRVRYVIALLMQYCEYWAAGPHAKLIVSEHGRLLIGTQAIQKLAAIEQWDTDNA